MSAETNGAIRLAKAAANDLGLHGKERHDFLADYIAPRPSNPHKIARAEAYRVATTRDYWRQCAALMPWYLRFFGAIFPFVRRRLLDRVARLYRFNLARLAQDFYAHRPGTREHAEWLSLQRARRKAEKKRAKARLATDDEAKKAAEIAEQRKAAKLAERAKHKTRLKAKLGPRYVEKEAAS